MNRTLIAAALTLALCAGRTSAKTYEIDPAHSTVGFTVRHLVTKVHGTFDKVAGTVEWEAGKPESWKAAVEIDPASIDTRVSARDAHLRSPDFFDVQKCPKMSFKTTKVEAKDNGGKLYGDLTMHCVTKPVVLDLEIGGEAKDPGGRAHFGASATGKLDRKDWGLTWNKALEAGGMMVGDEVALQLDIEALPGNGGGSLKAAEKKGEKAAQKAGEKGPSDPKK